MDFENNDGKNIIMNELLQFDQHATMALNGSNMLFWDNLMMTVTSTLSWSLLILTIIYVLFHNNAVREAFIILLMMVLMIFVADRLCSGLIKPLVGRWRPTQDPHIMYMMDVVDNYRGGKFGFFSGHACNTFCMATFLALLFRHRFLIVVLYFWSVTTTFTRLYLGVHYLGDVLVGLTIGMIIGLLFYTISKKILKRYKVRERLSSYEYTSSGYKLYDIHMLLAMIFVNYLLIIIVAVCRGIV